MIVPKRRQGVLMCPEVGVRVATSEALWLRYVSATSPPSLSGSVYHRYQWPDYVPSVINLIDKKGANEQFIIGVRFLGHPETV